VLNSNDKQPAAIKLDIKQGSASCSGAWTLAGITALQRTLKSLQVPDGKSLILDAAQISKLDTAGAWLLHVFMTQMAAKNITIHLQGLNADQQILLSLVEQQTQKVHKVSSPVPVNILERIGMRTFLMARQGRNFLAFLGEVVQTIFFWIRYPKNIQWKLIFGTVESAGYRALPILALLSFLIGIVLSYQMGLQLRSYGANIYIVDLLGVSILREFGPLITAIIIAGRSGSAFTAEIGTMQVNEELDALRTMGISPVERLVLQKIFALLIAMPLLTVWSDMMGVLGGMIMAHNILDINFYDFLTRFGAEIKLKHFLLGLLKTPVFAIIIACVGCYQGLQVKGSADSVGRQTTRSVVQAIFLIICADALFSILYSWYDV
jgi:phospholipid/cholesterol/gamma-HCH transport system permease protein